VITSFSFQEKEIDENVLYIKNEAGTYTDEFIQLLQPYYLNM
jgi:tRNA1(Val) A37 N6-methylase TrmN6